MDLATILLKVAGDLAVGATASALADKIFARRPRLYDSPRVETCVLAPLILDGIVFMEPGKGSSRGTPLKQQYDRYFLTSFGIRVVNRLSSAFGSDTLPGAQAKGVGTNIGSVSSSADEAADRNRVDGAPARGWLTALIDEGVEAANGLEGFTNKDETAAISRADDWDSNATEAVSVNLSAHHAVALKNPADIPNSVLKGATFVGERRPRRWRELQAMLVQLRKFRDDPDGPR